MWQSKNLVIRFSRIYLGSCRHSRIVGQFFNFWITHWIFIAVASFTIFMNVVILMLVKKFFTVSFSRKWSEERIERNVHFRKTATIEHSFWYIGSFLKTLNEYILRSSKDLIMQFYRTHGGQKRMDTPILRG